ncbi:MAG: 2-C-methyl-D-erythritol 4-phosphate cytidylyltransferase [Planctomycetota bacterium]
MIGASWVVLVAAGEGSRLGGDGRKAAIQLHGRSLASISLAAAMAHSSCRGAVLVVHPDDLARASGWVRESTVEPSVQVVAGGRQRRDSVLAGLDALEADPADLVVIHDGARPALHVEDLQRVLEAGADSDAATLATPVIDTLHQLDGDGHWSQRVDRNRLWQAQTPQIFRLGLLREVLRAASGSQTDEVEAVASTGQEVQFVEAQHPNPKITTAADVRSIEALLDG